MSLDAQAKVLRVLETREVLPVGATRPVAVDIRVLCATHRDLAAAIRTGAFRADLYARIAHRTVVVPSLRSRKEDIYAIAVRYLASRGRFAEPSVSFIHRLLVHDWPFNVRELLSALAYAVDMAGNDELRATHLPASVGAKTLAAAVPASADASPSSQALEAAQPRSRRPGPTREELSLLLAQERGNMQAVARVLDRDPAQVYRWLRKFALDPEDFR
jgi:transcriptional regulator of acetoin/glycerol metabolism